MFNPCCCSTKVCTNNCQDNRASNQYRIVLTSIVKTGGGTCFNAPGCGGWNATFIITWPSSSCSAVLIAGPTFCDSTNGDCNYQIGLQFYKQGSDYITQILLTQANFGGPPCSGGGRAFFEINHGTSPPDCTAFSDTNVPYVATTAGGNTSGLFDQNQCDASGATCLLTSL